MAPPWSCHQSIGTTEIENCTIECFEVGSPVQESHHGGSRWTQNTGGVAITKPFDQSVKTCSDHKDGCVGKIDDDNRMDDLNAPLATHYTHKGVLAVSDINKLRDSGTRWTNGIENGWLTRSMEVSN